MSNMHPHDLHQVIRSWLLAEDPYGMNQRQEPTFPDARAPAAGQAAVENALRDPRGETAGPEAVDKEMDKVNTEQWRGKMEGRKAQRAQAGAEGRAAVGDAISPANVRAMIQAQTQQPQWASPQESGAYASGVGENAVAGAMPPPQGPAGWYEPTPMTAPARTSDPNMPHQQTRSRSPGKSEQDDTPSE